MHLHTVIVVCGPTAVGKTSFAILLARQLQTQIISADSRQCFKELNIGVAKPSARELSAVHHYFINSHSIFDDVNAGIFEDYALQAADQIFKMNPVAVMVGGTGLYIRAFCEGMDPIPKIKPHIRQQVIIDYERNGLPYLQKEVREKDPAFWEGAEQQNPQRLMRALEVVLSTGRSVVNFREGEKAQRPFNIIKIGLELPRDQLYKQINQRVDNMVKEGLVEEAFGLLHYRSINALQTVGYSELFDHFDGNLSLVAAIENIRTNTRRYAKRQLTWFKKDGEITWITSPNKETFQGVLDNIMSTIPTV